MCRVRVVEKHQRLKKVLLCDEFLLKVPLNPKSAFAVWGTKGCWWGWASWLGAASPLHTASKGVCGCTVSLINDFPIFYGLQTAYSTTLLRKQSTPIPRTGRNYMSRGEYQLWHGGLNPLDPSINLHTAFKDKWQQFLTVGWPSCHLQSNEGISNIVIN